MKKNTLIPLFAAGFAAVIFSCAKEEKQAEALQLNLPATTLDYTGANIPDHMRNEFMFNAPGVFANLAVDPNGGGVVIIDNGGGVPIDNGGIIPIENGGFFIDEFGSFITRNPSITNDGATLGRVLFYDTKMSINNAVSCASCHKQEFAFADPTAGSKGFGGKVTPRNSMAIVNVALNRNLFWDSRVQSATELTLKPVQNHIEMGMEDLDILVKKLSNVPYYPALFEKAFGDSKITEQRLSSALAQFLCSMVSVDSRFDASIAGTQQLSDMEQIGQALFFSERTKCSQCHSGNNFAADDRPGGEYGSGGGGSISGNSGPKGTANNGLDLVTTDPGLEKGQFRIPSLRNVALTGPYMHDGRLGTLEEVVEFYNSGVKLHSNLDKKLIGEDGEPLRLHLTSLEKKALVAFLESLTDQTLVNDVKFSNPFN